MIVTELTDTPPIDETPRAEVPWVERLDMTVATALLRSLLLLLVEVIAKSMTTTLLLARSWRRARGSALPATDTPGTDEDSAA